ncbi:hypothetical protein MBRA_58280 (plasmid) [Mycobacterium branderi]|uniref:Uncharacterized protein n=1 Tax=Mycobacterium branderi TaxID=43348 RepID=A0ABM7KWT5_9MYCO|nr:hypothetical protein MBRA_58280 [Mycobacterium branderi]
MMAGLLGMRTDPFQEPSHWTWSIGQQTVAVIVFGAVALVGFAVFAGLARRWGSPYPV